MISCENAKQLFDRYLDGDLPSSLQTELHAHQLNCSACQGELAILEACGDVIGMDTSEPAPNAAFTDRVMFAYRAQRAKKTRRWPKVAAWSGGAMAAAASIALAFTLNSSTKTEMTVPGPTNVAGYSERVPDTVSNFLTAQTNVNRTDEEIAAIESIKPMESAGFVDSLFVPIMNNAQTSLSKARRGASELQLLFDVGLSSTSERLSAQEADSNDGTTDATFGGLTPLPGAFDTPPAHGDRDVEALPEAL